LITLDQLGVDLVVEVNDEQHSYVVDHPTGSTGPELVLLGPYQSDRKISLFVTSKTAAPDITYDFSAIDIAPDTDQYDALKQFETAGTLTHQLNSTSIDDAISLYQQVNQSDALLGLQPELHYYALYLQASLLFKKYDLIEAQRVLDKIPQNACAVPSFCYKGRLLTALISNYHGDTARVAIESQAVISEISLQDRQIFLQPDLAQVLINFGHSQIGNPELTLTTLADQQCAEVPKHFADSLSIGLALEHYSLIGEAYNGMATYHHRTTNDKECAVYYLERAVEELEKTTDERALVAALTNLSITYRNMGEYSLAQATAQKTLIPAETTIDQYLPREVYLQLGSLYFLLGEFLKAEHYARLAMEYDIRSGRESRFNQARMLLGKVMRQKGNLLEATSMHRDAFEYYSSQGMTQVTISAAHELVLDFIESADLASAQEYLNIAQALSDPADSNKPENVKIQSRFMLADGRYHAAIELLTQGLSQQRDRELVIATKIELQQLLMQAYWLNGEFTQAREAGENAIALITTVQGELEYRRLGPAWSAVTNDTFKFLADILLQQYAQTGDMALAEKAFVIFEQSLAVSLQQQRIHLNDHNLSSTADKKLRLRLTELSRKRASSSISKQEYEAVSQRYFRTLELYQADQASPVNLPQSSRLSLHQLQEKIPANTSAVEFLCVPQQNCNAFLVGPNEFEVIDLGSYEDIELQVNDFNRGLRANTNASTNRIDSGNRGLASLLQDKVFSNPVIADSAELLIVSDYPLSIIPLAPLDISPSSDETRYLAEQFTLKQVPALTAIIDTEADQQFEVELAVLADPVFSSKQVQLASTDDAQFRGWVEGLGRLRWSAQEAENLKTVFVNEDIRVYTGEHANRSNLFHPDTRNARILHIASHAYFNEGISDLVGIAFSSDYDQANADGDFVTLTDLLGSRFNSEIVVISGCETGQGQYLAGEGDMSLARGFLAQGANHVISTLWPVPDRESAEFMGYFYHALHSQKQSVQKALQAAQLRMSSRHPLYWGSYILTSVSN